MCGYGYIRADIHVALHVPSGAIPVAGYKAMVELTVSSQPWYFIPISAHLKSSSAKC